MAGDTICHDLEALELGTGAPDRRERRGEWIRGLGNSAWQGWRNGKRGPVGVLAKSALASSRIGLQQGHVPPAPQSRPGKPGENLQRHSCKKAEKPVCQTQWPLLRRISRGKGVLGRGEACSEHTGAKPWGPRTQPGSLFGK